MIVQSILRSVCLLLALCGSQAAAQEPSLDTMIGQMLMIGFRGLGPTEGSHIVRDLEGTGIGGVVLFDYDVALKSPVRNIASPAQVRDLVAGLQARSAIPLFAAVDQEGGRVQRLKPRFGFPDFPSAAELGRGSIQATRKAGRKIGETLKSVGLNVDFAPAVDVNINPDNPVIGRLGRSFSSDPEAVAAHAEAFIRGLDDAGIIACPKHFPGHGSSTADSHLGFTDVTRTWRDEELIPFVRLIREGLCPMIMTAHVFNARLDPDQPATFSPAAITGLLRERRGYDGVVVTDDLQMKAAADGRPLEERLRLAILAGADVMLFGNNLEYDPDIAPKAAAAIKSLVEQGRLPKARIARSYERIMALKRSRLAAP